MNSLYIASNVIKNALVGVLGDALLQRGSLGMDQRPELILETMQNVGDMLGSSTSVLDINGELIYELGPGRTPFLMIAMALAGARKVVGLDVRNWMAEGYQNNQFIEKMISIINQDEATKFRQVFNITEESLKQNVFRFSSTDVVGYRLFSGDNIHEGDNTVGFLYSKSVLEHIRRSQVELAIEDHFRVLKPGAFALHIIDLRDHLHIRGDHEVQGDWLDALSYPEWLHNAMTSNRRAYINRLRANKWRMIFESQGFEIAEWRTRHTPLPESFSTERLNKDFSSSNEDFSISWVSVLLHKPL